MSKNVAEGDQGLHGKRVAVLGYGAEGRTRALALRESGHDVVVAMRPGGMSWVRAVADGFRPCPHAEAVANADVVAIFVPPAEQPALYTSSVAPYLKPGALLVFANAAAVSSRMVEPNAAADVVLVRERDDDESHQHRCFVAVHRDGTGHACARAIAYARAAFGAVAANVETTTFAEETAIDLCDQAFHKGGVPELVATWEKLLACAGHEPDEACLAYYERLKSVVSASPLSSSKIPTPPKSHVSVKDDQAPRPSTWDEMLKHTQRGVA